MKRKILIAALALCVLVFGGFTMRAQQRPARQEWEYKIVAFGKVDQPSELNTLGSDGWELVNAERYKNEMLQTTGTVYYFKRPKQ